MYFISENGITEWRGQCHSNYKATNGIFHECGGFRQQWVQVSKSTEDLSMTQMKWVMMKSMMVKDNAYEGASTSTIGGELGDETYQNHEGIKFPAKGRLKEH